VRALLAAGNQLRSPDGEARSSLQTLTLTSGLTGS
jgi:hypothetical protein